MGGGGGLRCKQNILIKYSFYQCMSGLQCILVKAKIKEANCKLYLYGFYVYCPFGSNYNTLYRLGK